MMENKRLIDSATLLIAVRTGRRKTGKECRNSVFLFVAIFSILVGTGPAVALDWTVQTVDTTGNAGVYTSLALDSARRPRIGYVEWDSRDLKYAAWNGSGWQIETVDDRYVEGVSLALGQNDNPHIAYPCSQSMTYAAWSGSEWAYETVDGVGQSAQFCSIALGAGGDPHISYEQRAYPNDNIRYAVRNDSTWNVEVLSNADRPGRISLDLDSAGNPHIGWALANSGTIYHTFWNGTSWQEQYVDDVEYGWHVSMALDSSDTPHFCYADWRALVSNQLNYASWNGTSWDIETVDDSTDVGQDCSLAVDDMGNPHISYLDHKNGNLKYAAWDGSHWIIETIDSIGDVGYYTSIAVDEFGYVHISYSDGGNGDLKYAYGVPEPATLSLLMVGGLALIRRRRK